MPKRRIVQPLITCVGVLLWACGGNGGGIQDEVTTPSGTPPATQSVAQAVEQRDARALVEALGGSPQDSVALEDAQRLFTELPNGSRLEPDGQTTSWENSSFRIEEEPYRVVIPGEPTRTVLLRRLFVRSGQEWAQVSVEVKEDR